MPITPLETSYRLLVRGARAAAPLLSGGDSKLARGLRGRRGAAGRLATWGRDARDVAKPLVWFHAPSVGEGLQARAVMEALRERRNDVQLVFTHFSPSAEGLAASIPADVADYLPWDVTGDVTTALDALRPTLLVFTKTEVWPVLVEESGRRGTDAVLVAATLPEGSSRLVWPARAVLRPAFSRLAAVMAIAPEDGSRFERVGAVPSRVHVTGDPGIDSAARRAGAADPDAPALRPFRPARMGGRPTLVAGSTWPPDEDVLLEALGRVRAEHPDLRLIVAPHEPDEGHLGPLEASLRRSGGTVRRLAEIEEAGDAGDADAVVVDRVGVLAHLYTVGDFAYVGGGFHGQGLHSVLEPAAAGIPVLFGPRHGNARAASDLVECGGGRAVPDAGGMATAILALLDGSSERAASGRAARRYIESHLGAAGRTADRLVALLP